MSQGLTSGLKVKRKRVGEHLKIRWLHKYLKPVMTLSFTQALGQAMIGTFEWLKNLAILELRWRVLLIGWEKNSHQCWGVFQGAFTAGEMT